MQFIAIKYKRLSGRSQIVFEHAVMLSFARCQFLAESLIKRFKQFGLAGRYIEFSKGREQRKLCSNFDQPKAEFNITVSAMISLWNHPQDYSAEKSTID